ncbi:MAG TPA: glutamine--fructose-6-phosphate transaminase (isomerizing) [Candidatus Acidoferrales bacterium]|nr:glutamine--fructose-6-phosphate transaminase (isomerizing) [Candidatus Acidoferrales bacterium]
MRAVCGISAAALQTGQVGPVLYESLKRLEYRGYDSVGEATLVDGKIALKKDKGKIREVEKELQISELGGHIGIGHTRWATHGRPSKENAHPHTDCYDQVAVVHNGIIENFMQLKQELEAHGHRFKSRTDTEIVAHLVEENLKSGLGVVEAVRLAAKRLTGAYALALICAAEPDKVVCVRKESPLILGVGTDGNYCASDIPAFLSHTKQALILEDDEMAVLTADRVQLMKVQTGEEVSRKPFTVEWTVDTALKTGYPHFMLKEIHEQPLTVRNALRTHPLYLDLMASAINRAKRVFLIACGTSYHACLVASYAFANLAKIEVTSVVASEFIEGYAALVDQDTVVLTVSQSGETADTLTAVRAAKDRGASILGITNVMGSTLTRLSDVYIGQNSGPEMGVAATKTFTAQVSVLLRIVVALAQKRKTISKSDIESIENGFERLPEWVSATLLGNEDRVKRIVEKYSSRISFCFLGRGISVATALEGRLKLLELSYLPAIAYPAGESKHGFISVVEDGYPVVFVAPRDEAYSKIIGNVMEMKARQAQVISIIEQQDNQISSLSDETILMPDGVPSMLTPILYIVPMQLFAYHMAVRKGYDPDFPRNLAKSVTVH